MGLVFASALGILKSMKKLVLLLMMVTAVGAQASNLDAVIKKHKIPSEYLGLWVQGPDKKFGLNEDKLFTPASLSKIPTAAAVLAELGLNYQFETRVWTTGSIVGDTLNGDVYLQGGGDPAVVSESYWVLVNEFKRSGIRKIKGQLYVDDTFYDQSRFSESRQSRRVDRAYDAPIGALSFNWNSVNVFVRPGERGEAAKVFADPENEYITLKNLCKTGSKTDISVSRVTQKNGDVIEVRGTIAAGAAEQVVYKSISSPEFWAGYNFKAFLNQQGVSYAGDVQQKTVPAAAQLVAVFKSKPLRDMVTDMAKFSNNYVAEMLTMALSTKRPATLESGVTAIKSWMLKNGVKQGDFIFENPSGFSNDNKMKPKALGQILEAMRQDLRVAPEFMVSLPASGIDGTMKRRLKDLPAQVRAKTGYLTGAIGLAGYAEKNGRLYSFVFIYNGPEKFDAKSRDLFDDLLRAL